MCERDIVIMIIPGHDWRYSGGGMRWEVPEGEPARWEHLVRKPHSEKRCITCHFSGPPNAVARPCHELWAERTGLRAAAK